jgi:hypothetical protein
MIPMVRTKSAVFAFLSGLLFLSISLLIQSEDKAASISNKSSTWWNIQSVDTMKYSRDLARLKLRDSAFDEVINQQISEIAQTGATHVGIATPYDEEFVPILARWVHSARSHGLKVWFRGNFAGWEEWFGYPRISRAQHLIKTQDFIKAHGAIFEEGDLFTPCPECENGGPGDPRSNGDVAGHRQFLIDQYRVATDAFRAIGKGVSVGYFSMNYDVAKLTMDKATTEAVGGTVTIDHYVRTPEQLARDVAFIAEQSGGKVYIGEIGAPIPDIHGGMDENAQHKWLSETLMLLQKEQSVVGVNYWVNVGGSTQLWTDSGYSRKAVQALTTAFTPRFIEATLVDQVGKPIDGAFLSAGFKNTISSESGEFALAVLPDENTFTISGANLVDTTVHIDKLVPNATIIIERTNVTPLERFMHYINGLIE